MFACCLHCVSFVCIVAAATKFTWYSFASWWIMLMQRPMNIRTVSIHTFFLNTKKTKTIDFWGDFPLKWLFRLINCTFAALSIKKTHRKRNGDTEIFFCTEIFFYIEIFFHSNTEICFVLLLKFTDFQLKIHRAHTFIDKSMNDDGTQAIRPTFSHFDIDSVFSMDDFVFFSLFLFTEFTSFGWAFWLFINWFRFYSDLTLLHGAHCMAFLGAYLASFQYTPFFRIFCRTTTKLFNTFASLW